MRIFFLEAGKADLGDIVPRASLALGLRVAAELQPEGDVAHTVAQGISAKSWNTKARSGPGPLTGLPFTSTSPEVAGSRPAMIFSSVVFPQPEGPSSEVSSPRGKSTLIWSSAWTPPG